MTGAPVEPGEAPRTLLYTLFCALTYGGKDLRLNVIAQSVCHIFNIIFYINSSRADALNPTFFFHHHDV
jgi:hypothetical protein